MKFITNLHAKTITRFSDLDEEGQSTAEYSLVIVGAAAVAGILIAWASKGNGKGGIGHLLDNVIKSLF